MILKFLENWLLNIVNLFCIYLIDVILNKRYTKSAVNFVRYSNYNIPTAKGNVYWSEHINLH
jgi:hypothetical protein